MDNCASKRHLLLTNVFVFLLALANIGLWVKVQVHEEVQNDFGVELGRVKRESPPENSNANVEFIHPKLRDDMKGQREDPDNPWVWLTSYARIPVNIKHFCSLICKILILPQLFMYCNITH